MWEEKKNNEAGYDGENVPCSKGSSAVCDVL